MWKLHMEDIKILKYILHLTNFKSSNLQVTRSLPGAKRISDCDMCVQRVCKISVS